MKKTITYLTMAVALFSATQSIAGAAEPDIYPSNISSNVYFDSYDDITKTVKGVHFDVLTDGTNSTLSSSPFKIKLYLLLLGTNTPIFVKTIEVPNGQKHLTSVPYNIDVDLSLVSGLTTNDYRFGIFVDADDQVMEPNEENNTILFEDHVNYTQGAVIKEQPDLKIVDYKFTYVNKVLKFDYIKVQNIGNADAGALDIKILVEDVSDPENGNDYLTFSIDMIAEDYTFTAHPADFDLSQVPDGITLRLKLIVDPNGKVAESDESNNEIVASEDISVTTGLLNSTLSSDKRMIVTPSFIEIELPASDEITLNLFDVKGNRVGQVYNGSLTQGIHRFAHDLNTQQKGLYIYRLASNSMNVSKKIIID